MTLSIRQGAVRASCSGHLLEVPAVGEWHGTVTIASGPPIAIGPIVIDDGAGVTWAGTATEAAPDGGVTRVSVVGGAGGLRAPTAARHWAATTPALSVASTIAAQGGELVSAAPGSLASWRSRGGAVREEIARLARWVSASAWHVADDGAIRLEARAAGSAKAPGPLVTAPAGGGLTYARPTSSLAPMVGRTVAGVGVVGHALYASSAQGTPDVVTMWPALPERPQPTPPIVGAEVLTWEEPGRVDVRTDGGVELAGLPVWSAPGVVAVVDPGTRVLVLDLGDDPRAPIALASPFDALVSEVRIGIGTGRIIREGDIIMFPSGSAATPTPLPIAYGPGISDVGDPGTGYSNAKA